MFDGLWIAKLNVNIGIALGSRAAITATGLLLGAIAGIADDAADQAARARFTLLLTAGCAAAALLLNGLYGISKDNATPSWSLWGCVATGSYAVGCFSILFATLRTIGFIAKSTGRGGTKSCRAALSHFREMLPQAIALAGLENGVRGLAGPDAGACHRAGQRCARW